MRYNQIDIIKVAEQMLWPFLNILSEIFKKLRLQPPREGGGVHAVRPASIGLNLMWRIIFEDVEKALVLKVDSPMIDRESFAQYMS